MKITTLFLLLTLSTLSASARLFSITANLNGTNVVPVSATGNTGTLTGTFNDATGLLTYSITYSPLPFGRFHSGATGTNGPEISTFNLNANSPTSGARTLTATDITNLLAGNIYVELDYFSSKIRGQLAAVLIIDTFNEATKNNFYGIGGYSYSQFTFPTGLQPTPYVVSGPSPQNDFSYVINASSGAITNSGGVITTTNSNTNIHIEMKGNNVRKFACKVYAHVNDVTNPISNTINLIAFTNLGNQILQTANSAGQFVGFNVINENEYIVAVLAQFQTIPSPAARIALFSIMVGDNSPQNVALNFDGVDDYVSIPSNVGNFGTDDNFTVSCWVKPDINGVGEQNILNKYSGGGGYAFTIRYYAGSGTILAGQYDGTNFPYVQSTTNLKDGRWHHVAFVKNGNALLLYIDGIQEGVTGNDNANFPTTNGTPLQIGREATGTKYFKGEIDEVRIWNIAKDLLTIQNERFCKTPVIFNLQASYSFSNGVPHDNNALIMQVQTGVGTINHGTLNGFAKTGDASNFVTGQVKYVNINAQGNYNGSSWLNGFFFLYAALTPNTCNDLFDVYVAKSTAGYKPSYIGDINASFNIPSGMRLYGGFAGTEKSINQRNMALIHTTNQTPLSGDLSGNDTPFNFTTNRTDNSQTVVNITGSNASLDGFTIRGSRNSGVFISSGSTNTLIKHSKVIDNNLGIDVNGNNNTIANSIISGNQVNGVYATDADALTINNSLIANNGQQGVKIDVISGTKQTNISNSTIASNANYGITVFASPFATSNNTLKNILNYGNGFGGIFNENTGGFGTINNTITYSLVQGNAGGTNGNLNGNLVNPQFVSPLGSGFGSLNLANMGDYRLKWCSLAINAGTNTGISPLDLDRKPRNFNGTADMGAYEFLGNTPSQVAISNITGTIDSPTYAGGAIQTITSTAKILAPAGAIDFKAPNAIILNPGFEARGVGQYFKAQIGPNVGCVNN